MKASVQWQPTQLWQVAAAVAWSLCTQGPAKRFVPCHQLQTWLLLCAVHLDDLGLKVSRTAQ